VPFNKDYVETSNIVHYGAVVHACEAYAERVTSMMVCGQRACARVHTQTRFPVAEERVQVDLVLDEGVMWVKVVARSWRGLYEEWAGGGSRKSGRNIVEQVRVHIFTHTLSRANCSCAPHNTTSACFVHPKCDSSLPTAYQHRWQRTYGGYALT
jgi:ribonucleotide reductase alpha subunit